VAIGSVAIAGGLERAAEPVPRPRLVDARQETFEPLRGASGVAVGELEPRPQVLRVGVVGMARRVVVDRRAPGLDLPGGDQRFGASALRQRIVGEMAERLVERLDRGLLVALRRAEARQRQV
jgi:hypothetical protein